MQRTAFCIHHYKAVMPAEGDCGELRNGRFAPIAVVPTRTLTTRSRLYRNRNKLRRSTLLPTHFADVSIASAKNVLGPTERRQSAAPTGSHEKSCLSVAAICCSAQST